MLRSFKGFVPTLIWAQYARAMGIRRPDSILSEERFVNYLLRKDVVYMRKGRSFLIGQMRGKLFMPSHFAPVTGNRKQVRSLFLMATRRATVFVVTPDLVSKIWRAGFIPVGKTKVYWNGSWERKVIMISIPAILALPTVLGEIKKARSFWLEYGAVSSHRRNWRSLTSAWWSPYMRPRPTTTTNSNEW